MQSSLNCVLATAALLLLGLSSELMAQPARPTTQPTRPNPATQPARPNPTTQQPRPSQPAQPIQQTGGSRDVKQPAGQARVEIPAEKQAPPKEPPLSEELEEILRMWEQKSSQIKTIKGTHTRTFYNLVFQEERIAEGKFYLEMPDKGRIDMKGVQLKGQSKRKGKNGLPFKLIADRDEKWICTGNEVLMINDEDKSFEVVPLPPQLKGKNIINSPLPFLFGMKAEEAKRRFRISLQTDTKDEAILIVVPRLPQDQQNYTEAWVILSKTTYLPTAVKLFDPTGNVETVYKFTNVKINDRSWIDIFYEKEPFKPDLKSYKCVQPPMAEPEAPLKPASNSTRPATDTEKPNPQPIRLIP